MHTDKIPFVFIHQGDSRVLPTTFLQLRHTNPLAKIYLIGDMDNHHYHKLVEHVLLSDFFSRAGAFKQIYHHFSTNGYDFELICIQRWFVLLEFMLTNAMENCIYLDSDVLVYSNLNAIQPGLSVFGMTVTGISAHTNFVNNRNTLKEFCDFVWNVYSSGTANKDLSIRYQKFRETHLFGGISDMTFFTDFRNEYPDKIGDLSMIRQESVFDITLDTALEYEKEDTGYKKIIWKNNEPFAIQLRTGKLIRLHTLHFQGKCKMDIQLYITLSVFDRVKWFGLLSLHYAKRLFKKMFQ